jgi:ureidoglycolate lyase
MATGARSSPHWLTVEPLEARAFSPFGDVIEPGRAGKHRTINEGFAERFDDLARLDTGRQGGRPVLSVFRARPRALPLQLRLVERHLLGSQSFVPLLQQRFLVVVAPAGPSPTPAHLRCFMASPGQGVNYAAGTWHHPLIALDAGGDFLVIDRGGPSGADDCEEHSLVEADVWVREGVGR